MLFSRLFSLAALSAAVSAVSVSYDTGYDDGSRSLNAVACSDGENGLITRYGWQTQGQVRRFPYVGGVDVVDRWNSPQCGTCWKLTYGSKSINVLAIDHAANGFNLAIHAMNDLTNGHAADLGRVEAKAEKVPIAQCGL